MISPFFAASTAALGLAFLFSNNTPRELRCARERIMDAHFESAWAKICLICRLLSKKMPIVSTFWATQTLSSMQPFVRAVQLLVIFWQLFMRAETLQLIQQCSSAISVSNFGKAAVSNLQSLACEYAPLAIFILNFSSVTVLAVASFVSYTPALKNQTYQQQTWVFASSILRHSSCSAFCPY